MYRTGKPFHRCTTLFPYSFIIYVVLTTLLLAARANPAGGSTSQRDIKEAENIVGSFLRNEAGTAWLSGLAKTRSAPLTTQDLLNEIIQATRPGGQVWEAASLLSESLKERTQKGISTDTILAQPENWKDVIEHIENQDDIICLYRKSTEETAKKADDWKKFLKSVSPGYTVHLAIDTGSKYVICLKKIEVPETTSQEIVTTASTEATTVVPSTVTMQMTTSTTNSTTSTAPSDDNDENCDDEDLESTENRKNEDIRIDGTAEEYNSNKPKRGMEDDLSDEFGDKPMNSQQHWSRIPVSPLAQQKESYMRNNGGPLAGSPVRIPGGIDTGSSEVPECSGPIILVVQNGNTPMGLGPGQAFGVPIQQNLKLPFISRIPLSNTEMHRPLMFPPIRQHAPAHKLSRAPYNPFMLSNNLQQLPKINNLAKLISSFKTAVHKARSQPVFSQNTNLDYNVPRGRVQKPGVQDNGQSIMQSTKKTFVPPPLGIKPRGSQSVQQKRDDVNSLRYPLGHYIPRRGTGSVGPRFSQSALGTLPEITQWKVPTRKTLLPRANIPREADFLLPSQQARHRDHRRQYSQKNRDFQFQPVFESTSQPTAQSRVLSPSPNLPARNPCQTLSTSNDFLRASVLFPILAFIHPCLLRWNALHVTPEDNWSATQSLEYPVAKCSNSLVCPQAVNPFNNQFLRQLVPGPSPCNRPVKLQILINGNVQEPLKISVVSEPGQQIETVGSGVSKMPSGSRALGEGSFLASDLEDEEGNDSEEVSEGTKQVNDSDKESTVNPNDKKENKEENQDKNSPSRTTSDHPEKFDDKHTLPTELPEQTTNAGPETSGSDNPDIEDRFLHEVTTKTSSTNQTIEAVNTTVSAVTNSTIVE